MTQSTPIATPRRPRLRVLALIQGLLIVASLLAPLTASAAITLVTIGAQAPNPVTAGNDATYVVTVARTTSKAIRVTSVAGLPSGATFSSDCSVLSPAVLTLTIHTTVATPGGSSTITPTVTETTAGSCNGAGIPSETNSSASATLVVAKVNQTITFPGLADVRFDQAAPVPGATASSGLAVAYSTLSSACSVTSGGVITLLGVGSCLINANQAGNATYNPAPQQSQSFTITPGDQTISFGVLAAKTLADSPVTIGATASSGLPVSFSSTTSAVCTVAGTSVTLLGTGTCTIAADQGGNANWNAALQVLQGFIVSAAPKTDQTITFPGLADVRFDQAAPVPGATASSGLAVAYSTLSSACSVTSGGVITLLGVGSCLINANQAGNATYNPAPQQSQSFTITPGDQTISFGVLAAKTLADSPVTIGATASSGLPVSFSSTTSAVCTVAGTSVTLLGTGTCTIAADQGGNANWNAALQVLQGFIVSAAPKTDQTITFPGLADVRFDQAAPVPGATASSGLAVAYSTLSSACSVTSGGVITLLGVGSCLINANQAGNATYNPAPQQSQSFTITPGDQTISFGVLAAKTLADSPVTIGATASSGLPVSFSSTTSAVCTVAGTSVTLLGTGTCTIAADQGGNANWNAALQVLQGFIVSAAPKTDQTITFPGLADVRFDQAAPVPGATASSGLAVAYSTLSSACSVTSGGVITLLGVGSCLINANQAGNATYNPAPQQSQSFTITPGDQTISFGVLAAKTLADSPVTIGATASSGLPVSFSSTTSAVCTVAGTSVTLLGTGTCTIAADQGGNANWNAALQVLQGFIVSAAPVQPSLTLDKSTVPQGGKVVVSGQGYMPDDTVDVYLNSTPVLLTTVATTGSGGFSVTVTIPTTTVVGAHTIEGLGLDPSGEPLSLTAPITVTAAAAQPATDTTPTATAGKAPDPLPIGILLLLFLILSGVAVALADPRSARKQR